MFLLFVRNSFQGAVAPSRSSRSKIHLLPDPSLAQRRVLRQSFSPCLLAGEVSAGGFQWSFRWAFDRWRSQRGTVPGVGLMRA